MIASINNIASDATVTITPDSVLKDISVVTDGDYSSVYTDTLTGSVSIEFAFDEPVDIGYLAIGGSNVAKQTALTITTSGGIIASSLGKSESNVLVYQVDATSIETVTIDITGLGQIAIAEIAMGDYYTIPRGEQGGYKRPWTVPNIVARSSSSLDNSPVNLSYESRTLSCTLSIPNNIMEDFDGWYEFINFAANNTFYILEDDNEFHSYAGFNAVPAMTKAHSSTRKLGVSAITFDSFAKSSEALFK